MNKVKQMTWQQSENLDAIHRIQRKCSLNFFFEKMYEMTLNENFES